MWHTWYSCRKLHFKINIRVPEIIKSCDVMISRVSSATQHIHTWQTGLEGEIKCYVMQNQWGKHSGKWVVSLTRSHVLVLVKVRHHWSDTAGHIGVERGILRNKCDKIIRKTGIFPEQGWSFTKFYFWKHIETHSLTRTQDCNYTLVGTLHWFLWGKL